MPGEEDAKGPKPVYDGVFISILDYPVKLFREKFVIPMQTRKEPYPYYHRKFRRVPTIDQCSVEDYVCRFEANQQFKRDKKVDQNIVKILRQRKNECLTWEGTDSRVHCKKMIDDYEEAATNYFIKYGDLGATGDVRQAYMKQKHRLIWERRHGPVGSGMSVETN